jgi:hypothetical protein
VVARSFSEVSVEFAHVGSHEATRSPDGPDFSAAAAAHVDAALAWFAPERAKQQAGVGCSTVILVDDYFGDPTVRERQAVAVLDACAERDVTVDHVVYESSCAAVADRVVGRIADDPRPGDGAAMTESLSDSAASRDSAWLSSLGRRRLAPGQGIPRRGDSGSLLSRVAPAPGPDGDVQPVPHRGAKSIRGYHEINLEVQLYDGAVGNGGGEGKWSCPLLAACWQLLRLGVLQDGDGTPLQPALAELDHPALSTDPAPFAGRATLTLLSPGMLQVEHAVRLILGRLELAPNAVRQLRRSAEDEGRRPADVVLDRIAYGFIPVRYPRDAFGTAALLRAVRDGGVHAV